MPEKATPNMPDYEAAVSELHAIIEQMETVNLPLADSLKAYKRGTELIGHCQQSLTEAEQQVRILSDNQQLNAFKTEQESI